MLNFHLLFAENAKNASLSGTQRDCIKIPEDVHDGDCKPHIIGDINDTFCFCTTENCNTGNDLLPTTDTPTSTTAPSSGTKMSSLGSLAIPIIFATIYWKKINFV